MPSLSVMKSEPCVFWCLIMPSFGISGVPSIVPNRHWSSHSTVTTLWTT